MTLRKSWLVMLLTLTTAVTMAAEQVVLAVPPRQDLINLGFDLVGMFPRALTLVCHSGAGTDTRLEQFNTAANRWIEMPHAAWQQMRCGSLIVVGATGEIKPDKNAAQLLQDATAAGRTTLLNGARLHEVANEVNSSLRLTAAQWHKLSKTYGFSLAEVNADSRRYGRFGPPGGCHKNPPLPALMPAPAPAPVAAPERTTMTIAPASTTPPPATAAPVMTAPAKIESESVAIPAKEPIVPTAVAEEMRPEDK